MPPQRASPRALHPTYTAASEAAAEAGAGANSKPVSGQKHPAIAAAKRRN